MSRVADRLRALSASDAAWWTLVLAFTIAVLLPWWSTRILPLMDYPMFLSFVRVFQDHDNPASPFHGSYTLGLPFSPLVAPILLTAALAKLTSIETGGRLLWTFFALGLPASAWFLTRTLGLSRFNVLLVFPLVFAKWTSSGFTGFVTGLPLVLLAYALAARYLMHRSRGRGIAVGALMIVLVMWHALIVAQALLGLGILWLCWRAPNVKTRFVALWPMALPAVLLAIWFFYNFVGHGAGAGAKMTPPFWPPPRELFDAQKMFWAVLMLWPDSDLYAKALLVALVVGILFGARARIFAAPDAPTGDWHVKNPMAVIALVAFVCYFALPMHAFGVAIISQRFVWFAAVFMAVAWDWPRHPIARAVAIALPVLVAARFLWEVNAHFRAFNRETVAASRFIDEIPDRSTLIAPLGSAETKAFLNKPIREVQQYATIRKGGLPTTSFAGYGINYVRYVKRNPKPELFPYNYLRHPQLPEFDYVLLRSPSRTELTSPRLHLERTDGDWALFTVCGSHARPRC